ncbi:GNAT family N-acetyltransferase [Vibrio sp. NTOU-M3]|uniref:GNAT family N-acetyltransferase n=1 Tax=Vibrio sp. NTOU-M3 TaxID=3234954 RepID=UPI00349F1EE1
MIRIETSRLIMQQISENEWPLFQNLHQDEDVIRYAFDKPSVQEIRERFESRLPEWKWGSTHWLCLVIKDKNSKECIGITGLVISEKFGHTVEVGYLLKKAFHGQGYGTESLVGLIEHTQENYPVSEINAIVTDGNLPSCKLLEKAGFVLVERESDAYQIGNKLYDDLIYRYAV